MVGHEKDGKITITITSNALHFHRDTNFWWKTTMTLPAGTNPKQLHATITDSAGKDSIGTVVVAIFKVEAETLTLATGNGDGEAPKGFEATGLNRYELRKVEPQKTTGGSGLGSSVLEGHELATLFVTQAGIAQSTGTFTDSRDGQTYKTISYTNALTGTTVTWMAQNLNFKVPGSYAYDDKESNRKELGLLYTWEAASNACPKGWHVATDSEWSMLVTQFGGMDKAGDALKGVSSWIEDGNGSNSSGFDGLAGGIRRNGGYDVLGVMGFWWTSTPSGEEGKAWGWNFSYGGPGKKPLKTKAFRFDSSVSHAKSVRCVRD